MSLLTPSDIRRAVAKAGGGASRVNLVVVDSTGATIETLWGGASERETVGKGADFVDRRELAQQTSVTEPQDWALATFDQAGAMPPPMDPDTLCDLWENSSALRPNIDTYVQNVHGFGYKLEPIVDLDAPDARDKVASAIFQERLRLRDDPESLPGILAVRPEVGSDVVEAAAIDARMESIRHEMRIEKIRLENLLAFINPELSFDEILKRTAQDVELIGNGFWEIQRNGLGEIAQVTYVPGFTVRILPYDRDPAVVQQKIKTSPFTYGTYPRRKRFHRFVQLVVFDGRTTVLQSSIAGYAQIAYFKEFGDPRAVSSRTGRVYDSDVEFKKAEPDAVPANEMLHWKLHNPRSTYGTPRWMGVLLAVVGNRQAEEINFLWFDNKSIPPMLMMVSGGSLNEASHTRIANYIENNIKGRENFHKILVIEAQGAGGTDAGKIKIETKSLTDAHMKDALFMNYDERNTAKIGQAFRLPPIVRGETRDYNRATALAALNYADKNVFAPERAWRDDVINRRIFADLGIRYWRFESNGPSTTDPDSLAIILERFAKASLITAADARPSVEDVLGRTLPPLDAAWAQTPLEVQKMVADGARYGAGDLPATAEAQATPSGESGGAVSPAPAPEAKLGEPHPQAVAGWPAERGGGGV